MPYISKMSAKGVSHNIVGIPRSIKVTTLAGLPCSGNEHIEATLSGATEFSVGVGMQPGDRTVVTCIPNSSFTQRINGRDYNFSKNLKVKIYVLCISPGVYNTVVIENLCSTDPFISYRNAKFGDICYKDGRIESKESLANNNLDDVVGMVVYSTTSNPITSKANTRLKILNLTSLFLKDVYQPTIPTKWKKLPFCEYVPDPSAINTNYYGYIIHSIERIGGCFDIVINSKNPVAGAQIAKNYFNIFTANDNESMLSNGINTKQIHIDQASDSIYNKLQESISSYFSLNQDVINSYTDKFGEVISINNEYDCRIRIANMWTLKKLGLSKSKEILTDVINRIKTHPNFNASSYGSGPSLDNFITDLYAGSFLADNVTDVCGFDIPNGSNSADTNQYFVRNVIDYELKSASDTNYHDEDLSKFIVNICERPFAWLTTIDILAEYNIQSLEPRPDWLTINPNPLDVNICSGFDMQTNVEFGKSLKEAYHTYDVTYMKPGTHKGRWHVYDVIDSSVSAPAVDLTPVDLFAPRTTYPLNKKDLYTSEPYWTTLLEAKEGDILTNDGVIIDAEKLLNEKGVNGLYEILSQDYNHGISQNLGQCEHIYDDEPTDFHNGIFGICIKTDCWPNGGERLVFMDARFVTDILTISSGCAASITPQLQLQFGCDDTIADVLKVTDVRHAVQISEDQLLRGAGAIEANPKNNQSYLRYNRLENILNSRYTSKVYSGNNYYCVRGGIDMLDNLRGMYAVRGSLPCIGDVFRLEHLTTYVDDRIFKGMLLALNYLKSNNDWMPNTPEQIRPHDATNLINFKTTFMKQFSNTRFWTCQTDTNSIRKISPSKYEVDKLYIADIHTDGMNGNNSIQLTSVDQPNAICRGVLYLERTSNE